MSQGHTFRTHEEIVAGLRKRDPVALDAFFDRHADLVYGFALKATGQDALSRKLLSEVFAAAVPEIQETSTEQAVDRLLLREASQRILAAQDGGDGAGAQKEIDLEELTPDKAGGRGGSDHDWSLDPDEEARRPEEKKLLRELVVGMPPHYRMVIVLIDMEEMSLQDAAVILRISVPAARSRLHLGRLLLRRELTRRLLASGPAKGKPS